MIVVDLKHKQFECDKNINRSEIQEIANGTEESC